MEHRLFEAGLFAATGTLLAGIEVNIVRDNIAAQSPPMKLRQEMHSAIPLHPLRVHGRMAQELPWPSWLKLGLQVNHVNWTCSHSVTQHVGSCNWSKGTRGRPRQIGTSQLRERPDSAICLSQPGPSRSPQAHSAQAHQRQRSPALPTCAGLQTPIENL